MRAAIDGWHGLRTASALVLVGMTPLRCSLLPRWIAKYQTSALGGTTRLSFGPFLSVQDVKYAADALAEVASNREAMAM